jgi:outer membrane lipoprotein SlyB
MVIIPYSPSRNTQRMLQNTFSTTGTRAAPPRLYAARTIQPIVPTTSVLSGLSCCADCATNLGNVPYEVAKRMPRRRRGMAGFGATSVGPPVGAGAGAGAEIGASQGASIGSAIVPGIGTAIGAVIGAIGGAIAGSINKKDPENVNFDQAVAIWQANPNNVYAIGNKYLVLAGLFDLNLKNPHIPIYQKYGRMGEQKFVNDLVGVIYRAGLNGQITAQDTALTIMANVVQPWINSWGYGAMQDPHADMINRLIVGMILDYVTGTWKNQWYAVGGDFPFGSLPTFTLPQAAAPAPTSATAVAAPPPVTVSTPAPPPVTVSTPAPVTVTPVVATPTAPVVSTPSCTPPLVWNGSQCVAPPTTAAATTTTATTTALPVATVAASPPAGFTVIGNDTNGNPVFSNAQGVLYQWNGAAMQLFTGQLASGQSVAAQIQAAVQAALAQGQSTTQAAQTAIAQAQSQGLPVTQAMAPQIADQATAAAAAPTVTAGVAASGTSDWLWIAGAAAGLWLLMSRKHSNG